MTGFEFKEANNTFKAMCQKLRKEGKGQVEHKRSIKKGDIKSLYEHSYVFNTTCIHHQHEEHLHKTVSAVCSGQTRFCFQILDPVPSIH
jgi:hypothetical protein